MTQCASSSQVRIETVTAPPSGPQLAVATAADHCAVLSLLQSVFQAPTAGDFQTQLEEPFYEPNQRVVVRWGGRVVSHVRFCPREMHFGSLVLPVASLTELATAPAFRRRGLATAVLAESERLMEQDGALIGMVRTDVPEFFVRRGWSLAGAHSWSEAGAREILAQLNASARPAPPPTNPNDPPPRTQQLSTRIWRHVELSALERLYAANVRHACGPLVRSDDYWSWLISRRAFDAIYVAVQGPDRRELDDRPIVAYAVVRGGRVVELFGAPNSPRAVPVLLARICGEAIERDVHDVILDLAPDHPLHQVVLAAGGQQHRREFVGGQAFLAKVFRPWALLERLLPDLVERARQADLPLPAELVLQERNERRRLTITNRRATLEEVKGGRHPLVCAPGALSELLLGQWDVETGVARGRITSTASTTLQRAAALFPRLPMWRPSLEDMVA